MDEFYIQIDSLSAAPATEQSRIEQALWQRFGVDKIVMVLDMSHFTSVVHRLGLLHYLCMIRRMQLATAPIVAQHGGNVVKYDADNMFAVFDDSRGALQAAVAINRTLRDVNRTNDASRHINVCIGIGKGRIMLVGGGNDLYGDCVNIASKLGEDIASPEEILVTAEVYDEVRDLPDVQFGEIVFEVADMSVVAHRVIY